MRGWELPSHVQLTLTAWENLFTVCTTVACVGCEVRVWGVGRPGLGGPAGLELVLILGWGSDSGQPLTSDSMWEGCACLGTRRSAKLALQ